MNRLLVCLVLSTAALRPVHRHVTAAPTLYIFPNQGPTPIYAFINSATKSLDMTMYELVDSTAEQDLITLAAKGVKVRVLLDQKEELSNNQAAYTLLSANGVSVHWTSANYITHQKTITVDAKSSLILTSNLTSGYYPTARDFAITDMDTKDVAEIETVFNADFNGTAVTPTKADSLVWSPNLSSATLLAFINSAKHTLLVENEEMADPVIVTALSNRAKAGVAVSVVMTNYKNEYEYEFDDLTQAGVKVYTYPYAATGLYIHAKAMSRDYGLTGQSVYLGSINFSTTSESQNRELGTITSTAAVLKSVQTTLASDAKGGTLWTSTATNSPSVTPGAGTGQSPHLPRSDR